MAVNETLERQVLDEELALVEEAWTEAEAVAAISDAMLMPPALDRTLAAFRTNKGRRPAMTPVTVPPAGVRTATS
jgi:hypothetical protein